MGPTPAELMFHPSSVTAGARACIATPDAVPATTAVTAELFAGGGSAHPRTVSLLHAETVLPATSCHRPSVRVKHRPSSAAHVACEHAPSAMHAAMHRVALAPGKRPKQRNGGRVTHVAGQCDTALRPEYTAHDGGRGDAAGGSDADSRAPSGDADATERRRTAQPKSRADGAILLLAAARARG